ncbi:hypothetical protein [Roseateles sp.]|uniref:hypothetical protein n=1 Tax=Roseateles sp. TaxID=1971397 RepID=UPI003267F4A9
MRRDRAGQRKGDLGRVPAAFVALPWSVLDSGAYASLSATDKALLVEIARQSLRDNNDRLLASRAYLAGWGWESADTIHRATQNLLAAGLIHQTVQGHRPSKASWFALTWYLLDPHPGYDSGAAATFVRGSYLWPRLNRRRGASHRSGPRLLAPTPCRCGTGPGAPGHRPRRTSRRLNQLLAPQVQAA